VGNTRFFREKPEKKWVGASNPEKALAIFRNSK
jgi:hypothetical protein